MPHFDIQHSALIQHLESGQRLGELLFYPELSALSGSDSQLREHLTSNCQTVVSDIPLVELFRRRQANEVELASFGVKVRPEESSKWTSPVQLTFQAAVWNQNDELWLAYVPALGIEVSASKRSRLNDVVSANIQFALRRRNAVKSLDRLLAVSHCTELVVDDFDIPLEILTPKEAEEAAGRDREKSVLKDCATKLSKSGLRPAFRIEAQVSQLAELLSRNRASSVVLTGPSGVGKTAVLHELVRQSTKLGFVRRVWTTSGSRLVSGTAGFGMWQERCQSLVKEAGRKQIVLHVGSLMELVEAGRGGGNGQGIAAFLRSSIERGEITLVAECTPEQHAVIERQEPGLLQSFTELRVKEPDEETGRHILSDFARTVGKQRTSDGGHSQSEMITSEALQRLDRLHRRFATYSVYPGRPLRFLRNLLDDRSADDSVTAAQVTTAFSRETGLPAWLLDAAQKFDPDHVRHWFAERVLGQPAAISLVVELLSAARAALTRPGRPIASLLLIGPTGVGKTELARSLAEFFYQDRQRMVRIDMSEYADPLAAERLIGGPYHGDGVLTSQVRDQPFGVVLLDEFEKADPRCFDLLLQVLGEGRLTDGSGNVADFRNTIIVMTSNLGAESARPDGLGFGSPEAQSDQTNNEQQRSPQLSKGSALDQHYLRAVRAFLRPEMFNRIDRIVPFQPLDVATLRKVAEREMKLVSKRDGIAFRGVSLNIDDSTMATVTKLGFDPRYGARPLKRAIEREVLRPLAAGVNRYAGDAPLNAEVTADQGAIKVKVRSVKKEAETSGTITSVSLMESRAAVEFAETVATLRRKSLRLESSPFVLDLRNEVFRLERWIEKASANARKSSSAKRRGYPDPTDLKRLGVLKSFLAKAESVRGDVSGLEDELLTTLYGGKTVDVETCSELLEGLNSLWNNILLEGFDLSFRESKTNAATLVVYGDQANGLQRLVDAYRDAAAARSYTVRVVAILPSGKDLERQLPARDFWIGKRDPKSRQDDDPPAPENETVLIGRPLETTSDLKIPGQAIGIALRMQGQLALPLVESEQGNHVFVESSRSRRCYVDVSAQDFGTYMPPPKIDRRGMYENEPNRRTWHTNKESVHDAVLRRQFRWNRESVSELMTRMLHDRLIQDAENVLGLHNQESVES